MPAAIPLTPILQQRSLQDDRRVANVLSKHIYTEVITTRDGFCCSRMSGSHHPLRFPGLRSSLCLPVLLSLFLSVLIFDGTLSAQTVTRGPYLQIGTPN